MKTTLIGILMAVGASQAWPAAPIPVAGAVTASWVDPLPEGSVVSGIGTSSVQWGTTIDGSVDNILRFTPSSFDTLSDAPFKVGSLYYQNGSILNQAVLGTVDLRLDLGTTTPDIGHVVGDYQFTINNTGNNGDPIASADYVTFPPFDRVGPKTAFFTVDGTTYSLRLTGFENVVGDGFLQSTDAGFHVQEQGHATADLMAVVTPVPEPSTAALMLSGIAFTFALSRRRNRAVQRG